MIKFVAELDQSHLFGFGLSEANLNRLEFNSEPIFFDFGYMGRPDLFGLVLYLTDLETPEDVAANLDRLRQCCTPFFDLAHGVNFDTLRVFPIARSVMQKLRDTPFWGFGTQVEVTSPQDKQLFFAGRTEQEIEDYLRNAGLIAPQTKRTYKGFGRCD